jgi:hypothetical protein
VVKQKDKLLEIIKKTIKKDDYLIFLARKDEKGLDFQVWHMGMSYPEILGLFEVQVDLAKQRIAESFRVPSEEVESEKQTILHRNEVT